MEIVCDTNIWYNLGSGAINPKTLNPEHKFVATFISIDEVVTTTKLLHLEDYTRKAIQCIFRFSRSHAIFEPPLVFLKILDDPGFSYNIVKNHEDILRTTELIAKGFSISNEKEAEFIAYVEERKSNLKDIANSFNAAAKEAKTRIKNKAKHRNENSIPINRKFISHLVAEQTNSTGLSQSFDWQQVSLFENTLKLFLNELETGASAFTPNDFNDLFLLVYVNPTRKYWTNENKWKNLIRKAGMQDYLYEK